MLFRFFKTNLAIFFFSATFLLYFQQHVKASDVIYFHSGFETGDVSEWIGDGGGNHTGGGLVTSNKAHSGNYCWEAYNDPSLPFPDNISAKLLRWRFDYKEAYYSAWYFWPQDFQVNGVKGQYVNIFQWKERADPWDPSWIVAVKNSNTFPGEDEIVVHDYHNAKIYRNGVKLPKGRWFHLQAFMRVGTQDGHLTVWLDDQEIFDFSNINTSGNPSNVSGYLMWGVGNYGDAALGKHIYIDDAMVTANRISIRAPEYLRIIVNK